MAIVKIGLAHKSTMQHMRVCVRNLFEGLNRHK